MRGSVQQYMHEASVRVVKGYDYQHDVVLGTWVHGLLHRYPRAVIVFRERGLIDGELYFLILNLKRASPRLSAVAKCSYTILYLATTMRAESTPVRRCPTSRSARGSIFLLVLKDYVLGKSQQVYLSRHSRKHLCIITRYHSLLEKTRSISLHELGLYLLYLLHYNITPNLNDGPGDILVRDRSLLVAFGTNLCSHRRPHPVIVSRRSLRC